MVHIDNVDGDNLDVIVGDQTSDAIVFEFFSEIGSTTMTATADIFDREIVVASDTNITAGVRLHILDISAKRGLLCSVTGKSGTTIYIDRPLDFSYSSGSIVIISTTEMNIDGTSTEQIFGLRTDSIDVPEQFDITNIRFLCIAGGSTDLSKFGNITALTNGITIRKKCCDNTYRNLVNIKSNAELNSKLGSFVPFSGVNPGLSEYGFFAEWKLAGQQNQGIAIRIGYGDEIEIVFNEDLSGLTLLKAVAIGHVVV